MNSSTVDLVGLGLNATDTLICIPELPSPGSKAVVSSLSIQPGGQVATAIMACRRWGLSTRYIGKLGDDRAAEIHRQVFADADVETQILTIPDCSSAQSHILVDGRGERSVLWHRDPRLELRPEELNREWIVSGRALLVDGCDTAAATQAAQWAREGGVPVIADLDDSYPGVEELLNSIDYLIVSRDFPARITGEPDLRKSLPWLANKFGCRLSAATLGREGVLAWNGARFYYFPAFRVPVMDTTGAGDIFHAGFIYGLVQGWPVERTLEFACAAAALNCTATGARGNVVSVDEIEGLIAQGARYPAIQF